MELEIYEAFISAGVKEEKEDKAKAAVESINKEIDKRYRLHADQLATWTLRKRRQKSLNGLLEPCSRRCPCLQASPNCFLKKSGRGQRDTFAALHVGFK
jgi:hypothetical protein